MNTLTKLFKDSGHLASRRGYTVQSATPLLHFYLKFKISVKTSHGSFPPADTHDYRNSSTVRN